MNGPRGAVCMNLAASEYDRRPILPMIQSQLLLVFCTFGIFMLLHPDSASAQPGFLTVDCGSSTSFVDTNTGIVYEADTKYISTGVTVSVPTQDKKAFSTLRYFPPESTPTKNCYTLPVLASSQYLVRAFFSHSGYAPPPPSGHITFQLALDATFWTDVDINSLTSGPPYNYFSEEAIVMTRPLQTNLSFCLIRTGNGSDRVPFISTLELRPLPGTMYLGNYDTPSVFFLDMLRRYNFGDSTTEIRYPGDVYDRVWDPFRDTDDVALSGIFSREYTEVSAPAGRTFLPLPAINEDTPPDIVMQTAVTNPTLLNYTLLVNCTLHPLLYISFFIAEVEVSKATRIIDVSGSVGNNEGGVEISSVPFYVFPISNIARPAGDGYVNLQVAKSTTSLLGPVLNAFELYSVVDVAPGTDAAEATALAALKTDLNREVWSGDPCLPVPWVGLNCTGFQVTSIDLSNQGLSGVIPDFSGLTSLTYLNLSYNNFTGSLPGWVAGLTYLRTLDVSDNQLSGTFPSSYINRIREFRYSNNLQLTCVPTDGVDCPRSAANQPSRSSPPPPSAGSPGLSKGKKISRGLSIGAIVGGALVLVVFVGAVALYMYYCWWVKRVKNEASLVPAVRGKAQPFTLLAIKQATSNFGRKIGEGGFGPVYVGVLANQREVAVKVMSGKSEQGLSEFTNEIDLLSTVHHKRLVSLVGYCQEGRELILLYEYMPGGDLRQRLDGPKDLQSPLNWRQRLQIALDAAQGLEYLHHGCNPAIFHRDVKSSNILLTEHLGAKVADFGLSKLTGEGQTHVLTSVKGTPGYLDPEYNTTGRLTDKSDVYSFGVVLLELVTGKPPIDTSDDTRKFIADTVRAAVSTGSLHSVTDARLRGDYKAESVWIVAEVAMSCVKVSPAEARPTMTNVVAQLARALEVELVGQHAGGREDTGSSGSEIFSRSNSASNNCSANTSFVPLGPPSQIFHQDVSS